MARRARTTQTRDRRRARRHVAGRGRASSRARGGTAGKRSSSRRWSARVTRTSDALDLERGVFKGRSARAIALSLKRSPQRSTGRKADPFRAAMSMLNFQLNRAGRNLSPERRRVLKQAQSELRKAFGRGVR